MQIRGKLVLDKINEREGEWLELKKHTIGSSEIAALMGDSPYQSPYDLYQHKKNGGKIEENAAMWWGKQLESIILERFTIETGIIYKQPWSVYCDVDYEFATASPDSFLWIEEFDEYGIGEIKNVASYAREQWMQEPPRYYWCQVQWQLGILGLPWGFLIAKIDHELIYHKIFADNDWYREALLRACDFVDALKNNHPYTTVVPVTQEIKINPETNFVMLHENQADILARYVELNEEKSRLSKEVAKIEKEQKAIKEDLYAIAGDSTKLATADGQYTVLIDTVKVKPSSGYEYKKLTVKRTEQSET